MRLTALTLFGLLAATQALAGASSTAVRIPANDPTAANLSPYEISLRAFDACQVTQSRLLNTTREQVHTPCSCYAKRTVARMDKEEIAAFRRTGYFSDSARAKAVEALNYCKLKSPF
ncbi:hypothetical protein [Chelatococcus reniformis]|uniref:Uncharacterized protein n=1 Tax=Chelatococcus reniformis TaxID=1494448 RepID=A0A916UD83_9HYPH|nr:hypothetical protein [Chelatococcus reniformis]GGC69194.1 hypothetical protein GCM10010994_29670 [Chelatococcus reniformis]